MGIIAKKLSPTPDAVSEFLVESAKQISQEPGPGHTLLYMLRLSDGSLYTGITTNIEHRVRQHEEGKGSKYVRSRLPIQEVRVVLRDLHRTTALSLEHRLKQLSKSDKEWIFEYSAHEASFE